MTTLKEQMRWIKRGVQRRAVAQVLRRPSTESEICEQARKIAKNIRLRDVWAILVEFKQRGLALCLNPQDVKGKLFFYTDAGRNIAGRAFDRPVPPLSADVDWNLYSHVVRAKNRKLVLLQLYKAGSWPSERRTATALRNSLCERYPLGRNAISQALQDLKRPGLIAVEGPTRGSRYFSYRLSESGAAIARELRREGTGANMLPTSAARRCL